MHLSMCYPTTPTPRPSWAEVGIWHKKFAPLWGFDINKCYPTIWGIWQNLFFKVFLASNPHPSPHITPRVYVGICTLHLPHYGGIWHFDVSNLPYKPEGVVGLYIDKCIGGQTNKKDRSRVQRLGWVAIRIALDSTNRTNSISGPCCLILLTIVFFSCPLVLSSVSWH